MSKPTITMRGWRNRLAVNGDPADLPKDSLQVIDNCSVDLTGTLLTRLGTGLQTIRGLVHDDPDYAIASYHNAWLDRLGVLPAR